MSQDHSPNESFQIHIVFICRAMGMAPLRFKPLHSGYNVSLSIPMCIYSYSLITFLVVTQIVIASLHEPQYQMSPKSSTFVLESIVVYCDFFLITIIACIGVYGAPLRVRSLIKVMAEIASIDKIIGIKNYNAKERRMCILCVCFLFFVAVVQAKLTNYGQWTFIMGFCNYILQNMALIVEAQFPFTAMLVQARFVAANEALKLVAEQLSVSNFPITKSLDSRNIFTVKVAPVASQIRNSPAIVTTSLTGEKLLAVSASEAVSRIALVHSRLCNLVRRINEAHNILLCLTIFSTMSHLIVTPYYTVSEITKASDEHFIHFVILLLMRTLLQFVRLLGMVEPSYYTMTEIKKTENLVCRMLMSSPAASAASCSLELFSRQLMLQTVCYSPLGLYVLDRPLIASILGAVITYWVVLLQIKEVQ